MEERDLDSDPLRQFQRWFDEARDAGVAAPESMTLATAARDGRPSARMVLLKHAGDDGFVFHTNYESRKGGELAANPHAALLFYWQLLRRQVRVEGEVERISAKESEDYYRTRPLGSRIAAWASPQSRPVAGRDKLESLYAGAAARFPGDDVPRPPHWGGFRLVADRYEFWEHADNRLHDRVRYERDGDAWKRERLAP